MGIFKDYLLFFGVSNFLFAFVGLLSGLEIYRVAEIIPVIQNVDDSAGQPEAGI